MLALFASYEIIAVWGVWNLGANKYIKSYIRRRNMDKIIKDCKDDE